LLEIRIQQPGRDARTFVVDGHEALIGRAKECDVVLSDRHVSARHAKVLAGLVVIDLDSTNGTFVRGQRIRDAVVLREGSFRLGADEEDVRIEVREASPSEIGSTLVAGAEPETDPARDEPQPASRASDPNEATLNQNRELRGRVKKLEAKLAKYAETVVAPYKQKIKDLESKREVLERAVKALRAQQEASAENGSEPDTEVLTELQAEIDRLRAQLRESEERASRVEPLEREVERLRAELETARASDDAGEPGSARASLGSASSPGADEVGRILELEKLLTERTAQVRMLEARLEADDRA